ncbi:MAG: iron-containing alcohol dehydrogenase [Bacteroidales bacterium]|nr:iron-containing alcohol dehydrogenase [Bacteroidales bacterium]
MMQNFVYYNPTKIHFGKDVHQKLGKTIQKYGQNVLLVSGQGSIRKNGIYDACIATLAPFNIKVHEFSGIKPNPEINDVYEAIRFGKTNKVDVVLAIGGGSVIDSAKIIAAGITSDDDVWDYFVTSKKPLHSLPLIAVITIAATSSEMNSFSVIQNKSTQQKIGIGHSLFFPKESFMNPEFTYSVSPYQTACGLADIIAHNLEHWFGEGDSPLTDSIIKSTIHEIFEIAKPLLQNPTDYNLRARMLLASNIALCGITAMGKTSADWGAHGIGHMLSVLYNIPHGESLAISYPAWLESVPNKEDEKMIRFANEIMQTQNINDSITKMENFFQSLGLRTKLNENALNKNDSDNLLYIINKHKINGLNYTLNDSLRTEISHLIYI